MTESPAPKFYQLSLDERRARILQQAGLEDDALAVLTPDQADKMIENVIGVHALPLGVAHHFVVNGREVLVPMAIEEPSVVAGASFMARLAGTGGGFTAHCDPPHMIAQIQVTDLADPATARLRLLEQQDALLAEVAQIDPILAKLGGGPRRLEVRQLESPEIGAFLVVHLVYDVRDAMGANAVNTAAERLAPHIEAATGGRVRLRILTNLADQRLARARCTIPLAELAFDDYSAEDVRDGILAAYAFAAADPYRAATHNKGIMNGIDAVVIATGNDWRAVEAGAHAYAARGGRYTSLSTWGKDDQGNLVGTLEMPMAVGTVGGATRVHPTARAALKIMNVSSAAELAGVIVSVGLAQNLAALRALSTEGIQRGHMSLHARQVAIAAGAEGEQVEQVAARLVAEKAVRLDRAEEIIKAL